MKLRYVMDKLNAVPISCEDLLDMEIEYAFSSDLMSDVLAFVNKKTLLLTGLTNLQVIRTAEMIDMSAIVFVRNKKPNVDIIRLAVENGIVLMSTSHTLYSASGILYNSGLPGIQLELNNLEFNKNE